eukprot:COSAG01_NODE_34804_length_541_cov_14.647059_1_plen_80_part_10
MELARGGELFAKLCEIGKFKEEEARFYWQQLLQVRLHPLPAASNGGQCSECRLAGCLVLPHERPLPSRFEARKPAAGREG